MPVSPRHDDGVGAVVQEFAGRVHLSSRALGGPQLGDQRVELVRIHPAAHVLVVDEQHRRVAAGAHALAFLQRNGAVGRGFAEADAEPFLQVRGGLGRPLQRARQVGADRDLVPAVGLEVVHRVERGDFVHGHRRHAEIPGDEVHRLRREPALFVLRDRERRHHRRLLVLGRVLGDLAIDFLQCVSTQQRFGPPLTRVSLRSTPGYPLPGTHLWCMHQRSISPNTMSCVPMIATTSAIMCPRDISSSAARCGKPGARILRRYGLLAPSDTM